jgi:pyrroline-5-carboxylate reductase
MSAPLTTTAADRERATALLSTVGDVVWVDSDRAIDAVTALSGSGPAYVFLFIESLIKGGLALGLSEQQSRDLALSTLAGATKLAKQSPESPAVLRERVTSKGGTTAAALDVFAQQGFSATVAQAMAAADRRAAELSIEFGK